MAFLTGPDASKRNALFARWLLRGDGYICMLLYIVGLAWFCLLGSTNLNNGTYFSENALLPGLVYSELRSDTVQYAQRLANELLHERSGAHRSDTPHVWLQAKMRQIGLETYTHNFTLNYPLGGGQQFTGRNVYGILRAPRIGSTEAIVLSAPYRPADSTQPSVEFSVPILLAFAAHARKQLYWSKDLIFVITEKEQLGMQAWLQAYVGTGVDSVLNAGDLEARAGSIQAAINFELPAFDCAYMDVKIEGLNGQLPNLDLLNVVQRIALKEGIAAGHLQRDRHRRSATKSTHWQNLQHMLAMVRQQASGVPNGNHGLFHQYGIAAVTLEGHREPGVESAPTTSTQRDTNGAAAQLKLVEGTVRSINNLMERFHQSFFFYLMVASDRFVSIGDYIPSLVLMLAALLIKALIVYMHINRVPDRIDQRSDDADPDAEYVAVAEQVQYNMLAVGKAWLIVHALGLLSATLPIAGELNALAHGAGIRTEQFVVGMQCVLCMVQCGLLPFVLRMDAVERSVLHMWTLIELASVLLVVGMLNFSLALVLGTVVVPLVLLIGRLSLADGRRWGAIGVLALTHPLVVLFAFVCAVTALNFPELGFAAMFVRSLGATADAVTFAAVDAMIYGNWVYNVVVQVMLPIWLALWYIAVRAGDSPTLHTKND